jgi:hypothetical protein
VAMVCGPPPEGRSRWTIVLTAHAAKRRGMVAKGARDETPIVGEPRAKAVAGKKCGASRSWTRNTSSGWSRCWTF